MLWQRVTVQSEVNDMPGPGGLLIQDDALKADLSGFMGQVQCVYVDPPYFTGERFRHRVRVGKKAWKTGKTTLLLPGFDDFSGMTSRHYIDFLRRLIALSRELLNESGSFFLHLDYRMVAHARLLCDDIFGEQQFRNEIIWSYQTGGRSKKYFSRKHDNILFYAKSKQHYFDITSVPVGSRRDRQNHLKRHVDADGRTYRTIRSGGKLYTYYDDEPAYPDDVWTDVSQMQQKDPQRSGYPTQKPQALTDRVILCSTRPDDLVADLTCGSGTALVSAAENGRRFLGIDLACQALAVSRKRLAETALTCRAPFSEAGAHLEASVMPGIGYYTVRLAAYAPDDAVYEAHGFSPESERFADLDAVDQWYAGLITGDVLKVYAASYRSKKTPALQRTLQVPLLRGRVAVLTIDLFGNRILWAAPEGA